MEAEQRGRVRNNLITKREDFEAIISPQTFQRFKSMKRQADGSKEANSQKSNANGSTHQNSENDPCILKVTAEEYDQLKKKYTKNKKFVKQKPGEHQSSRSKSKSPSSLKLSAKTDGNKREKSASPRNSGAGLKQDGKNTQTKSIEKTSTPSRNSLKPENKTVSRKSYHGADGKTKPESVNKSRWSAGMASSKNVDNDKLMDASLLKGNHVASVQSNKESSSRLEESSSVDELDNAQDKKGREKTSHIPKSPNRQQTKNHKKDNKNRINSVEKENKNKTPKFPTSKDHNPSDKEKRDKNGKFSNNKGYARNADEMLESESSEHEKNVELIINQIKKNKIADITQNDLSNEQCDIQQNCIPKSMGDPNVSEGNKNILSNDSLKKGELQKFSELKLDDSVGPKICEDTKKMSPMNEKILTDQTEANLMTHVAKEVRIEEKVIVFPFVTKRMDTNLAPDALQPTVDLDNCLQNNISKCDGAPLEKDSNDNNFLTTKYQAVPGTSKTIDINLDQENLQGSLSTVAIKLVKKSTPAARTPIMLKTPKRLKDGEILSEMLIYKLGSHSTPRKIRKNRNLDSLRKSDWGTPATDRITSTFLKRSISKKIKGKMFIKKTSQGILQPLPISKLVPKNSPKREKPDKRSQAVSGDETYKVTPVSDLIKKFENLEKEEESASVQSKVAVTFKKNAIFEKWQNGAKNIQQGLHVLKEVKKKPDSEVPDKENKEASNEITELKTNLANEKEPIPTSNSNLINNNENFNSLTILNTDCIDSMSFVSLKFDQIYSDECADQTGKNMRFSDLYKEINFQLSDSDKNEASEKKNDGKPNVELDDSGKTNLESSTTSILQDNNVLSSDDKTIVSNNNQGQEKIFEEGTDVLKILEDDKSADDKNRNGEELGVPANQSTNDQPMDGLSFADNSIISNNKQGQGKIFQEEGTDVLNNLEDDNSADDKNRNGVEQEVAGVRANQSTEDQPMDGFRGFEEVVVAEGRIDTTGEDRASPAYEAGVVDGITDEDFGEIYRQKLLSMDSHEDDDDTSISTLLALSQKLSKQPTSYADYRKQFMAVQRRSLPPQKINRCDTDPKMSL